MQISFAESQYQHWTEWCGYWWSTFYITLFNWMVSHPDLAIAAIAAVVAVAAMYAHAKSERSRYSFPISRRP